MREYSHQATDMTIEALRRLKAPWTSAVSDARTLLVTTAESSIVRLTAERADIEPALEAVRLRADLVGPADAGSGEDTRVDVADLSQGRNDVVLFTGETWVEEHAATTGNGAGAVQSQTMQISGRAGQRPSTASIVCTTTDAIVIAAATGEGMLVRLGVRPMTLEIVTDRLAIARFLVQRGYSAE